MKISLQTLFALSPLAVLVVSISACDEDIMGPFEGSTVNLEISHVVGTADLVVDDVIRYANVAGNNYSVKDLRYYVSNFTVHFDDGSTYGSSAAHFVDARASRSETHSIQLENVPDGTVVGISMVYGLDAETNVDGALPNTLDTADMEWPPPMGGGYHYMKLEGRWEDSGNPGSLLGYTTHTGARFMPSMGDTYRHHHFINVYMDLVDTAIDHGESPEEGYEIRITYDVNGWYEDPVTYDFEALPQQMVMPLLDVQEQLMVNGPSCFSASFATV